MAKIMIVDDDIAICQMLLGLLRREGHSVLFAVDPAHLYTQLADFKPDLLILDVQMPGGGAPSATKVIERAGLGTVPTLFFSAMPLEHVREWFPPEPGRYYLQKGAALPDVLTAVVEALSLR